MILWFWVFFVQHFIRISGTGNNLLSSTYEFGFSVYLSVCIQHIFCEISHDIRKDLGPVEVGKFGSEKLLIFIILKMYQFKQKNTRKFEKDLNG